MTPSPLRLVGLLAALAACSASAAPRPVVVELYESQGCSSCPPANDNLAKAADRPNVIALNFAVTYWDGQGWKDTFAQPRFTARQWDYAHTFRRNNVFTPEVVVNGRHDGVGAAPADFAGLVAAGVGDAAQVLRIGGEFDAFDAGVAAHDDFAGFRQAVQVGIV